MEEEKSSAVAVAVAVAVAAAAAAGLLLFLPGEIIIDILSRLPVDSVILCKRVCKTWRSLVDHDPTFLAMHTHRSMMIKSVPAAAAPCCFFLHVHKYDLLSRLSTCRIHFLEYHENFKDKNINANNNNNSDDHVKLNDKPTLEKFLKPTLEKQDAYNRKIFLSCNGLILIASLYSTHGDTMMVFNPVTKEYVDLPPSGEEQEEFKSHGQYTSTGFGYHPVTKEYKIVRVIFIPKHTEEEVSEDEEDHEGYIYVYIYTLGRSSWSTRREIKANNDPADPSSCCFLFAHRGLHLNGVIHWLAAMDRVVILFDLADEEFKILPAPLPPSGHRHIFTDDTLCFCQIGTALGVLGGCLCYYRRLGVEGRRITNFTYFTTAEIWVLSKHKEAAGDEDEDEEKENSDANSCSWIKKFSSPSIYEENCSFVSALESGKILFLRFYEKRNDLHFVSYDPETDTSNIYGDDEGKSFLDPSYKWSAIIPYVKSFVSLKALGEEDAKYMCC